MQFLKWQTCLVWKLRAA